MKHKPFKVEQGMWETTQDIYKSWYVCEAGAGELLATIDTQDRMQQHAELMTEAPNMLVMLASARRHIDLSHIEGKAIYDDIGRLIQRLGNPFITPWQKQT